MTDPKRPLLEQLRGATRLAVEATRGVTDLVEQMHHTIGAGPAVLGRPLAGATKRFSGPSYRAVRGVAGLVGERLDRALSRLAPRVHLAGADEGPLLAALNGVLGEYLAETGNPLAIQPRLCSGGAALVLTPEALEAKFPTGARLLVLVHGSALGELQWLRKGHDHGAALAKDRGFVPIYFRYNSGRHVSENGRALAVLLEALVHAWPREVEEVVLLAHSMGGLVARAACHLGEVEGHAWRQRLRALVMLGTPNLGAPLERAGNWLEVLLGVSRYSAPLARLGHLRGAGVTDLRYGNVLEEDWKGKDRFAREREPGHILPLPRGVSCFAIAGSLSASAGEPPRSDGLVPVDSALGRHPTRALDFKDAHRWVALGTPHLDLLSSPEVYARLRQFLDREG
jgi:pimeloyl-ACP methyl ester carboxylesterase